MRLDKYLCECGLGTRSEVKQLIRKKLIKVNNLIVTDSSTQIEKSDLVYYKDNELIYNEFEYIVLNKPAGYITATEDNNSKTVMDLIKTNSRNLSPVGRLDKDTEGLLLITNNGTLNHNMLSPKKHVDKTYYVELKNDIKDAEIDLLCNGVDIKDDTLTLPAVVERISSNSINLTIHEGRYHQIKRMMEAIDNKVTYLKRLTFGPLILSDDLAIGDFRKLNQLEIEAITQYM